MAFHSNIPPEVSDKCKNVSKFPFLPLKVLEKTGASRGPAPEYMENIHGPDDIVDETLKLFKANVFFYEFEIKSDADRALIYGMLYITACLKKLEKCPNKDEGIRAMYSMAVGRFALPGESAFPLSHFYAQAKSSAESEELRKYMTQIRREIGFRLAEKVFDPELAPDGKPSKWWTCFAKRNFLKAPLIA